ncbi:hypothetical protein HMPREF9062_2453 [Actinomyces sp. oral taxon 448 str. F0400]|nr:hypothetical protein HMPREF9062_2453 [Actinomyces sp. oral taxon 448 str. F0400]
MSYLIVRASGEELERSLGVMGLVRAVLDRWALAHGSGRAASGSAHSRSRASARVGDRRRLTRAGG